VKKAAKVYIKNKPSQEVLDKVIADVNALGEAQYDQDGTLTFEFFCKTSLIVLQNKQMLTTEVLKEKCQERRRALKIKNDALYRSLTSESQVFKKNCKSHLQECVYDTAKVPKDVLKNTLKKYLQDPEYRAKYETNVKDQIPKIALKELSKAETLEAVTAYQTSRKMTAMMAFAMMRKGSGYMAVYKECKLAYTKTVDMLYNNTGVELRDMKFNVKRLNLAEDDDYKKLKAEHKAAKEKLFAESNENAVKNLKLIQRRVYNKKGVKKAGEEEETKQEEGADADDGIEAVEIDHEDDGQNTNVDAEEKAEAMQSPSKGDAVDDAPCGEETAEGTAASGKDEEETKKD